MQLGYELIKEQLFFRKELIERVDWFIRLRWLFVAAGIAANGALLVIDPRAPVAEIIGVLLVVGAYNGVFLKVSTRLRSHGSHEAEPFIRFAHVQISLDVGALLLIIYFTGGLYSPIFIFSVIHVIIAGILLSTVSCYVYGGIILSAVGAMTMLQNIRLLPVQPVLLRLSSQTYDLKFPETLLLFLIYSAAVMITAALTTSIKASIRAKGRELLLVSKEMEQNNRKLTALYEMVKVLGRCTELQALMDSATCSATQIMGVKGCSIKLLDEERKRLRFASTYGLSGNYLAKESIDIERSAVNRSIIEGSAHAVGEIQRKDGFQYPEDVEKEGISSMVCLPLRVERMIFGVFCVYSDILHFFNKEDIRFFELMSDLTALAIENLKSELNKTWFLHKSAHQLRSPLDTVASLLKTLSKSYLGPLTDKQQEAIERCQRRIEMLRTMIKDLLGLGIRRSGGEKACMHALNVCDVLDGLIQSFRVQAAEKNIKIQMEIDRALPKITADVAMLEDLFGNLISNALKYTPPGGKITVTLDTESDGRLCCRISDTGIGIPKENMPHLFSEFFRAENAKEFTEDGTGLGLVIVKEILDRLNGTIRINSEVGQGTEVCLFIPASGESALPGE
jgi:K+-sensing histidine kinase KdpD